MMFTVMPASLRFDWITCMTSFGEPPSVVISGAAISSVRSETPAAARSDFAIATSRVYSGASAQ